MVRVVMDNQQQKCYTATVTFAWRLPQTQPSGTSVEWGLCLNGCLLCASGGGGGGAGGISTHNDRPVQRALLVARVILQSANNTHIYNRKIGEQERNLWVTVSLPFQYKAVSEY